MFAFAGCEIKRADADADADVDVACGSLLPPLRGKAGMGGLLPVFFRGASKSTSPGVARRPVTFLVSPRKVAKRRRPRSPVLRTPLRCSPHRAAAQLVLVAARQGLRPCSPTSPDVSVLLGGSQGKAQTKWFAIGDEKIWSDRLGFLRQPNRQPNAEFSGAWHLREFVGAAS